MREPKKINNSDRKRIFKRAHWMIKGGAWDSESLSFSEALKRCWKELKDYRAKIEVQFIMDCNRIARLYNVKKCAQTELNESLQRAYDNGTNVNA